MAPDAHLRQGVIGLLAGAPVSMPQGEALEAAAATLSSSTIRLIDAATLDDEAASALCTQHGLASDFMRAARIGAWEFGTRMATQPEAPSWYQDAKISARVQDALTAVASGHKSSVSPFTGAVVPVTHNIGPEAFLLRNGDRQCIVLHWSEVACPFQDSGWYFPDADLLLFTPQARLTPEQWREALRGLLLCVGSDFERLADYLNQETAEVMLVEMECPHIGHYIWNGVSGWDGIFRWVDPEQLAAVAVCGPHRLLGGVDELYPDQLHPRTTVIDYPAERLLWDVIIQRRALAITVKDGWISADLAARVLRRSEARCSGAFRAELHRLRSATDPLILITLRLDNRSWHEQESGYVALIHALREEHPRLGVVIDGMNGEFNAGWSHAMMSLEAERALSERIVAGFGPEIPVLNTIGCSIAESMVAAKASDFFVAPIGAGMAKSRWIANLSGVAFSNRDWLDPAEHSGRLYDFYREGARSASYLGPEQVTDIGKDRGQGRRNFSLDWRHLHAAVRAFLGRAR